MDRFEYVKKRMSEDISIFQISKEMGISRSTIRYWVVNNFTTGHKTNLSSDDDVRKQCILNSPTYAYILGCYLGDGHIAKLKRTQRLCLYTGTTHPSIITDQINALKQLFRGNVVHSSKHPSCNMQIIKVHNNNLDKYFPQHGLGKKYDRDVSLSPWQQEIVTKDPEPFIKGLIDTDGSNYIRTYKGVEYECYSFTNKSVDIMNMYEHVLGLLGIKCKQTIRKDGIIRIFTQKRSDVQRINEIYDIADKKLCS